MSFAVVIGSYRLGDFVRLNIRQCRALFGDDTPILVSDDLSPESPAIKEMAALEDVSYVCPDARRSHFSGDWQAIVNASRWAEMNHRPYALKLSQRLIPLHPEFIDAIKRHLDDPKVGVVVPGQPHVRQFARPEATFYAGFGHLTDVVAFKPEALPAAMLVEAYRTLGSGPGKRRCDRLVEVCLGHVFKAISANWNAVKEDALANHRMGQPRLFIRKSQANRAEYQTLAEKHGLEGTWIMQEWAFIEQRGYMSTGPVV